MNFTSVDNNGRIEGYCLIKSADQKTSSKGDVYLDMMLSDASGEINAKLWRYSSAEHGEYKTNDIIKVRGTVSQYNNSDQLRIERIRLINDGDNVSIDDLVRRAGYSSQEMYDELVGIAQSFKNEELKKIVTEIYSDNRMCLLYWPAAFRLHHAIRGGLLMHTLSIVRLAQRVCEVYPFVDNEMLLAGAMLHDIAKLDEFSVSETGIADGYSVAGNLVGHIAMGAMTVEKYTERLGVKRETAVLLEHMILSHHGEPEFGAAVRPMTIEAELLSELDLLDSRIYEMREAVMAAKTGDFSQRVWALDNRKLYNHGRTDLNNDPKLF